MPSGVNFRAQLPIPEQWKLFDYWLERCGARTMPSREDIVPAEIASLLPGLGLVDVDCGFGASVVRLAGTALRDIYGAELTGKCLADIHRGEKAAYWRGIYRRLIEARVPLHGIVRGPVTGREHVVMAWLRLPLSDDDRRVNKVLCHDAFATAPLAPHRAIGAVECDSAARELCYA